MGYRKLDWIKDGYRKPWVSRKYQRTDSDEVVHDLKCDICGKWYNYSSRDIARIEREGRWNPQKNRPHHCGNSLCWDYYRRYVRHLLQVAKTHMPYLFK